MGIGVKTEARASLRSEPEERESGGIGYLQYLARKQQEKKDEAGRAARYMEMMQNRLQVAAMAEPYVGKYFSEEYIRRHILHQDDETILRIDSQINKEIDQNPEPEETEQPEV